MPKYPLGTPPLVKREFQIETFLKWGNILAGFYHHLLLKLSR